MSYRMDAAPERVYYDGALPDPAVTGLTIMGWFRTRVSRNATTAYWRTSTAAGGTIHLVGSDGDGLDINVFTTSGSITDTYDNAVDEWVHIAVVDDGSLVRQYVTPLGSEMVSQSGAILSGVPAQLCIGGRRSDDANEWFNGAFAHVRVFAGALSPAQIAAERDSTTPVLAAWASWALSTGTDLADSSGNDRHLVAVAPGATTEGDPITDPEPPGDALGLNIRKIAEAFLVGVEAHFTAAGQDLPARRYLAPGNPAQIAWDCEQLVVSLTGIGWGPAPDISAPSPKMAAQVSAMGVRHAVLSIALVRCTPSGGQRTGPTAAEIHASGQQYMRDAGLLSQAIAEICSRVKQNLDPTALVQPGVVQPSGPEGGYHGLEGSVAITAGNLV